MPKIVNYDFEDIQQRKEGTLLIDKAFWELIGRLYDVKPASVRRWFYRKLKNGEIPKESIVKPKKEKADLSTPYVHDLYKSKGLSEIEKIYEEAVLDKIRNGTSVGERGSFIPPKLHDLGFTAIMKSSEDIIPTWNEIEDFVKLYGVKKEASSTIKAMCKQLIRYNKGATYKAVYEVITYMSHTKEALKEFNRRKT